MRRCLEFNPHAECLESDGREELRFVTIRNKIERKDDPGFVDAVMNDDRLSLKLSNEFPA